MFVTIEYSVVAEQESKFLKAMGQYARVRRRDGAYEMGDLSRYRGDQSVCRDILGPLVGGNTYVSTIGRQMRIVR